MKYCALRSRINVTQFTQHTCGIDIASSFRRVAEFVAKILGGAKPADLPVEQPTKFELVVNLKNAQGHRRRVADFAPAARRRGDRMSDFAVRMRRARGAAVTG